MAKVNVLTKLSLATAGAAVVALSVSGTAQAASGFAGSYDPSNWTVDNFTDLSLFGGEVEGSVDTTGAPGSITIIGGNGDISDFAIGRTLYSTIAAASGDVMFDWSYITTDIFGAIADPLVYTVNGTVTQLTDIFNSTQSGVGTFAVNAGDTFGFGINTLGNTFGGATAVISNFHAPEPVVPTPVSEPASLVGILGLGAFGVTSLRKRKQQGTVKA